MGMDLSGKGGYFRCTHSGWGDVLELAQEFSWQPMGTEPNENELRQLRSALRKKGKTPEQVKRAVSRARKTDRGPYHSNDGLTVVARDAKAIAYALGTALSAIEDLFTQRGERTKMKSLLDNRVMAMLRSYADADSRTMLREFIAYCEAGRFEIH